jgi:hypothetical protein
MQNNIEILHHQAMELVDSFACAGGDRAMLAKQQGDEAGGMELLRSPLAQAKLSVLHRSAASLAVECLQLREVERLIGRALAGNPSLDVANELQDLLLDRYIL